MTGHFYIGICFPFYTVLPHIWVTVKKKSAGELLCSRAHCIQFMNDSLGGWSRRGGWLNTNSILPALQQRLRLLYAQTWYAVCMCQYRRHRCGNTELIRAVPIQTRFCSIKEARGRLRFQISPWNACDNDMAHTDIFKRQ